MTQIADPILCQLWSRLQCTADKPLFLISWQGSNPHLPSLLLNSHIDVVPVFPVSFAAAFAPSCVS